MIMPFQRFSRSRRQPKWIIQQILQQSPKRPAHPAKIVKHISGPLSDGSVVKEISDFEVYIKAVFTPESLEEIEREDDSQLDWNKALIILNRYSVEFKLHDQLEFCEYYIWIEKFQIWDVQEGFDLKEDVQFCMGNAAVQEKAKTRWQEMRSSGLSESFTLTQVLEAMLQNDSVSSLNLTHGGNITHSAPLEESERISSNNGPSTEDSQEVLKAAMSIEEFKISDSQQKELEKIKEWDENYIPTQSDMDSPPADIPCRQSINSPEDLQPGQPNQRRAYITRTSINYTPTQTDMDSPPADIPCRQSINSPEDLQPGQPNQCRAYNTRASQRKMTQKEDKLPEEISLKQDEFGLSQTAIEENEEEIQPLQTQDHQGTNINELDVFSGGTQGFVPQLHMNGEDIIGTAPFSPQLSPNTGPDEHVSPVSNSGDSNFPVQDTSPVLISSSGEANDNSEETTKSNGKGSDECQKNSSDDVQFHLCPPVLSPSPENSEGKSRESPRLNHMAHSALKSFQDHFEMMVENERLKHLAEGYLDQRQLRSQKRLLDESSEEEIMNKRKKTDDGNMEIGDKTIERSISVSGTDLVSNGMNKLLNFVSKSTKSSSAEDKNAVSLEENIHNFSSSSGEESGEESQSLIQSRKKGSSKVSPKRKLQCDTVEKSKTIDKGAVVVNDESESRQEDDILISSTDDYDSQEEDIVGVNITLERQTTPHMIEQDQEISSSLGPQLLILPKQQAPEDEIGQKLFHLTLPPDLKTRVLNYWKKK